MAIDFPNSPATNDVYSAGGKAWVWNGTAWVSYSNEVGSNEPGFRNKIINGGFDIWQRGGGAFTTFGITADQMRMSTNGSTHSSSRQAFTLGNAIPGYEPAYFYRTAVTSVAGAGNFIHTGHHIEDVRTFAGQTVTYSLWIKADVACNVAFECVQDFGTGGSPSSAVLGIGSQLIPVTTSWVRKAVTISVPSISGKTLGTNNDHSVSFRLWYDAGSTYDTRSASLGQQSRTIDIWGVQAEAGSYASRFEQRPIATELALCQRYFYRWDPVGVTNHVIAIGQVYGTTTTILAIDHPQTMRIGPTSSISNVSHFAQQNATATGQALTVWSHQKATPKTSYVITTVGSGLVAGNASALVNSSTSAYIDFTAEL